MRLGNVKKISLYLLLIVLAILSQSLSSCNKFKSFSKGNLSFSIDTVVFDTVFTTIGSTTQQFKIYNTSNKTVKIEEVELMGGENSPFRINLDGNKGLKFENLLLEGKDSLFAFVEVTLVANNATLPMLIEDSIRFRTNGIDQFVKLAVWGQDAYFHHSNFQTQEYDLNEGVWPNDKPHVIYGAAFVDSAKTLTIPAGTQVHLHKNAVFYVYKGSLQIDGQLNNEVVFQGDRLEQEYQNVAGQYYGIYFDHALPSTINYAILKNGTVGVHLVSEDPSNSTYTLEMNNSIIQNTSRYGVFIYSGAKVKAENSIIYKNENHALLVLEGGDFNFNHCNLLGYGASQVPAVGISNYFYNSTTGITQVGSINEGVLKNCILAGNLDYELAIDTILLNGVNVNFNFSHSLIRSVTTYNDPFYSNIIWNQNPLFVNVSENDYGFQVNSPLNGAGITSSVLSDILGNPRSNPPDIGAIEIQ